MRLRLIVCRPCCRCSLCPRTMARAGADLIWDGKSAAAWFLVNAHDRTASICMARMIYPVRSKCIVAAERRQRAEPPSSGDEGRSGRIATGC